MPDDDFFLLSDPGDAPDAADDPGADSTPAGRSESGALSVSDLTRWVRTLLENEVGEVWVEGEISNLRRQASGHRYFTLKDESSQLSCVFFRGSARYCKAELRDGMQVRLFGEISVYEAQGKYQLIVRTAQEKGVGELQARFEALKEKLRAEGLFDAERKKPLPAFPRTIGLVTSPTGAAVRDMLQVLARRAPSVRVIIHPVRVQGDGAYREITQALQDLDQAETYGLPKIDTIVLARGGGSIEDLWNFNEEPLAYAISQCETPVVSAVGHEIDFTIADFVADERAPTPSAAAELIVPDTAELGHRLDQLATRVRNQLDRALESFRDHLARLRDGALIREPARQLREHQQRTDSLAESLAGRLQGVLQTRRLQLEHAGRTLDATRPERGVAARRQALDALAQKWRQASRHQAQRLHERVEHLGALLRSLGPEATLARGFSITTDAEGSVLRDAAAVKKGARIRTRLHKGEVRSTVDEASI